MTAYAGQIASPADYNTDTRKLVARAYRTSNSSTTTTEVAVLRLDGLALKSGRLYFITTGPVAADSSVNSDGLRLVLRYTTDGTTATTASAALSLTQVIQPNAAASETFMAGASYAPGSDVTVSVVLTVARSTGSGSVGALGDPTFPIEIFVWDGGVDPGNTGVSL